MSRYVLASGSPRRRELFRLISTDFDVFPSGIAETVPAGMPALEQPEYLARLKANDIAGRYPAYTVIGADTAVLADGKLLGKPENAESARKMLKMLSCKTHTVITGCAVCEKGECRSFSERTDVTFYPLSDSEIDAYIATGEPFDKAGAYGIQGKGALFVRQITGDYFNVVGLPVARLARVLKAEY